MMVSSPEELKDYFLRLAPAFLSRWNSEENYNIEDDGTFTYCGVCNEFAHYFIDQARFKGKSIRRIEPEWQETIDDDKLVELFNFVEVVLNDSNSTSSLCSSLKSCFLEDIAQTDSGEYAKKYMGNKSLEFFSKWHL